MDFRHRKQELLERAERVEEKAFCEKNTQAKGIMRALAALYREMAEELEDSGLFERRFPPLHFADLAGGDRSKPHHRRRGLKKGSSCLTQI